MGLAELKETRRKLAEEGAPPSLEEVVKELQKKLKHIHVAFIFDKAYGICETWRILMNMLNSTQKGGLNEYGDWQAFSNELGLDYQLIMSIDNVQPGFEDPVTNTLLAFAQQPEGTLDRIIDALVSMKREDILLKISTPISELCEKVLRTHSGASMISGDSGFSESENLSVITPNYIPDVPCLLRRKEDLHFNIIYSGFRVKSSQNLSQVGESIEHNGLVQSADEGYGNDANPPKVDDLEMDNSNRSNFDTTVLLTFASDGHETALKIARTLRETTNGRGEHVGVVILDEQQQLLNSDPQAFVRGVFDQVDYVLPVITPEYLHAIKTTSTESLHDCLDAQYSRFIYKLMENYYTSNHCLNKKIRSILPSGTDNVIVNQVKKNPVLGPFNWYEKVPNIAVKICYRKF